MTPPNHKPVLKDILEKDVDAKYTLSDRLWQYLQDYAVRHRAKGNGFGYGLADLNGITRTLSARYYKDGSEILIPQEGKNPRRLTPRECARLQGFDDSFIIPVSDNRRTSSSNSVVVPAHAELIVSKMESMDESEVRRENVDSISEKAIQAVSRGSFIANFI